MRREIVPLVGKGRVNQQNLGRKLAGVIGSISLSSVDDQVRKRFCQSVIVNILVQVVYDCCPPFCVIDSLFGCVDAYTARSAPRRMVFRRWSSFGRVGQSSRNAISFGLSEILLRNGHGGIVPNGRLCADFTTRKQGVKWRRKAMRPRRRGLKFHNDG